MSNIPLAERLRPHTLDDYVGQEHLVGKNGVFRKFFETGNVPSFILWGPPGVGKTTLARIVASQLERPFFTLSAVTSGVKEVREVIESARKQRFFDQRAPFLFIDEIHRFNKSQQDSLLGAVEQGVVTLIGATTENPSFEVISPLLSRCQVYILKPLEDKDLEVLLHRALTTDTELREREIEVVETGALLRFAGGDARKLLNILDILAGATDGKLTITDRYVTDCLQQNIALYDKQGEQHYDVISAFIKSVRGCDPNRAAAGQRLLRHGAQDRHARGAHHAGRDDDLPGHEPQEQLGLHGHQPRPGDGRARHDEPSRAAAPAQCPDAAHEGGRLRQGLQVRPRLRRALRRAGVPARVARRNKILRTRRAECRRGEDRRAHPHALERQILIPMKRIGILSDTHGTFDERLREFFRDVDEIWHAGDIGSLELADRIAAFKPLRAVSGNIDGGLTRRVYPQFLTFTCEEVPVLMTHIGGYPRHYAPHIVDRIRAVRPRLFVCGHSHILRVMYDEVYDLLAVNPGAAGEYGFHRTRTAVRLVIDGAQMRDMEVGEWPRRGQEQ